MPFSRDYHFRRFTPAQRENLQAAYRETCEILGHDPITTPIKDEIAREIIQIYECGVSSPNKIAELMQRIESVRPKSVAEQFFQQVPVQRIKSV